MHGFLPSLRSRVVRSARRARNTPYCIIRDPSAKFDTNAAEVNRYPLVAVQQFPRNAYGEPAMKHARLLLFGLFLISVVVRLPGLDRPVSKHHEFNTAFFLIPMEIWEKEGLVQHGFIPPYNYFSSNDKYIAEPIGIEAGNKDGTYYYLSIPSLSYLVPYGIFQLLHLPPSPLGLRLFNLCLHLLLCLMLFEVLAKLFPVRAALLGTVFHLFSPGTLWFHGNGYTHHIFAAFLVVAALYALSLILFSTKRNAWHLLFYTATLFLLFLTEWISVFFALTVMLVMFIHRKRVPASRAIIGCSIVATAFGLGLLLFQYAHYIGLEHYFAYQRDRLGWRSTWSGSSSLVAQGTAWLKWTIVSFGPWIVFIAALGGWALLRRKQGARPAPALQNVFLLLVLIPALLYHLTFGQFTMEHDYAVMIDALGWAFLLALLIASTHIPRRSIAVVVAGVAALGIAQYFYINRPGAYGQNGDPYTIYQDIGETIRRTSTPEDTIFITGFDASVNRNNPQVMYYAKRNFKPVDNVEEALDFLHSHHRLKGKLYVLKGGKVEGIHTLNP